MYTMAFFIQMIETIIFTKLENNWTEQFLRLSNGGYEPMKHLLKTQKLLQWLSVFQLLVGT